MDPANASGQATIENDDKIGSKEKSQSNLYDAHDGARGGTSGGANDDSFTEKDATMEGEAL